MNGIAVRKAGAARPCGTIVYKMDLYLHALLFAHVLACRAALQEDCPLFSEGHDRHSVLQAAAMAAKWWEPARDALDTMVLNAAALHELEPYSHVDYMPFDPAVKVSHMHCLPQVSICLIRHFARFVLTWLPT